MAGPLKVISSASGWFGMADNSVQANPKGAMAAGFLGFVMGLGLFLFHRTPVGERFLSPPGSLAPASAPFLEVLPFHDAVHSSRFDDRRPLVHVGRCLLPVLAIALDHRGSRVKSHSVGCG